MTSTISYCINCIYFDIWGNEKCNTCCKSTVNDTPTNYKPIGLKVNQTSIRQEAIKCED